MGGNFGVATTFEYAVHPGSRLRAFGPPAADVIGPMPYPALQGMFDASAPKGEAELLEVRISARADGHGYRCARGEGRRDAIPAVRDSRASSARSSKPRCSWHDRVRPPRQPVRAAPGGHVA